MLISSKVYAAALVCALCVGGAAARAQTFITDFSYFTSNELYASWNEPDAIIDSGENSYSITATGYGSNYAFIGGAAVIGAGIPTWNWKWASAARRRRTENLGRSSAWWTRRQLLQLRLVRSDVGRPCARANLGCSAVDQRPGTTPGLDLDQLLHMHMQLDPSTVRRDRRLHHRVEEPRADRGCAGRLRRGRGCRWGRLPLLAAQSQLRRVSRLEGKLPDGGPRSRRGSRLGPRAVVVGLAGRRAAALAAQARRVR